MGYFFEVLLYGFPIIETGSFLQALYPRLQQFGCVSVCLI
jgi:hypothetical protein